MRPTDSVVQAPPPLDADADARLAALEARVDRALALVHAQDRAAAAHRARVRERQRQHRYQRWGLTPQGAAAVAALREARRERDGG